MNQQSTPFPLNGLRRREVLCSLAALGTLPLATAAQAQTTSASAQTAAAPTSSTPPSPRRNYAGGAPEQIDDPRVSHFDLRSSQADEPAWRIYLAKPAAPAPQSGYRALFLLDGNATFPMAWHALERLRQGQGPAAERAAQTVLVGLGYPADVRFDVQRRFYDYTPQTDPATMGGRGSTRTGGQDVFLDFVAHDVRSAIAKQLPLDQLQQGLYGHSLGGLLCLYALYTRPALFRTWIAADPSIWWNAGSLLRHEAAFLSTLQLAGNKLTDPMKVLIERSSSKPRARDAQTQTSNTTPNTAAPINASNGSAHTANTRLNNANVNSTNASGRASVPASQALDTGKALARIQGMQVFYHQFEDESHPSMMQPSINDAVGFFLGNTPSHLQSL
ncbi:alpha/beta hydrolase [Lampropedia puyangensis]|uniref:Acyl-CoA:diacylglycerol acyltransferase n=1 Tax=Lampropedia puyangensis TaxID=1330072 RepID=A0A4V4GQP8_9BURK|nr:alpha/beta hydrolase-fold protein [Lampropedia puyangensis]THT99015.1 alpha/beta hydrolase [Lampropedia puyangensis]